MATRTRSGISAAVHYEEISLESEWKEDDRANILLILAPDFAKEQLKITCVHSTRTIRVTGERKIACNKWYKFSQIFPVPKNCDLHNIQAKFRDRKLTITMPKSTITQDAVAPPQPVGRKVRNMATAAKDAAKGLAMEMNEDRRTMAVTVLVITAIGACLYYRHKSPGDVQENTC